MAATRLAVPLTHGDVPLDEQVRAAQQAGADLVELRVDCLGDVEAVAALLRQPRTLPFILTIRTVAEGGRWDGDEADRVALFERLGLLRPGYVDVEYAAWARSANLRQKIGLVAARGGGRVGSASRARNRLILSCHDVRGTPADLEAVARPLRHAPADVIKLVFTGRDATDAWRVMALLRHHARTRRMIALAMGEAGLLTRVLAPKFGGFLTFAALERGSESAPGQPTVRELLEEYRWRDIGPRTAVFGVVGWPVAHSLSPRIHNAAMAAARVDGVYVPMPVLPAYEDFAAFMELLCAHSEFDLAGLSVTIPHKEHALRWLDDRGLTVSAVARRVGAVNTLTCHGPARWSGDNTDVAGVLTAIGGAADGRRVAVLGAGGVARAVVVALLERGCQVTVFNRAPARAASLAEELGCQWRPWEERGRAEVDVIVNCTSVGMQPHVDELPFSAKALRPGLLVFDTVYNPPQTRLLREAQARGCRAISGVEMFLAQAARQFQLWHRRLPPADSMRSALAGPPTPNPT